MQVKACTKCGVQKPLDAFNRRATTQDGLRTDCRACQSAYNAVRYASDAGRFKASARAYDEANRPEVLARKKTYYAGNREPLLERFRAHCALPEVRARRSEYRSRYAKEHPELERAWARAYRQKAPEKNAARTAARFAKQRRAVPPWADLERIKSIYAEARRLTRETGIPHHVDHVIPLRSPIVCGLHCEANLWVLPAWANVLKSNRYWPGGPL